MKELIYPFVIKTNEAVTPMLYIINNKDSLKKFALMFLRNRYRSGLWYRSKLEVLRFKNEELNRIAKSSLPESDKALKVQIVDTFYKEELKFSSMLESLFSTGDDTTTLHILFENESELAINCLFLRENHSTEGFIMFPPADIKKHRGNAMLIDIL